MSIFQSVDEKYIKNTEWVKEHSYGIESLHKCDKNHFQLLRETSIKQEDSMAW